MIRKLILGAIICLSLSSCGDFLESSADKQAAIDDKLIQDYIKTQGYKSFEKLGSTPNFQYKTGTGTSKAINPADELTFYYKMSLLNGIVVDSVGESSGAPAVSVFGGNFVLSSVAKLSDLARSIPGFILAVVSTQQGETSTTLLTSDWVNGQTPFGPFAASSNARVDIKMLKVRTEAQRIEDFVNQYLKENKTIAASKNTEGLHYIKLTNGTGSMVESGKSLTIKYAGYLLTGAKFDEGQFAFVPGAGSVVKGFDQAVLQMAIGEKARFVFPNALGYGARSPSTAIPPYSPMVFDIEVVSQ
jgi:hypothetical protein